MTNTVKHIDTAATSLVSAKPTPAKPAQTGPAQARPCRAARAKPVSVKRPRAKPAQVLADKPAETGKKKKKWFHRLFGALMKKKPKTKPPTPQGSVSDPGASAGGPASAKPAQAKPSKDGKKKKKWWHRLFGTLVKKQPKTKPSPPQDSSKATAEVEADRSSSGGKQKTSCWLSKCFKRCNQMSPSSTVKETKSRMSPPHRSTTNDDKKQDLKRPSTPELQEPVKSKADLEPDCIEAITEDLVTLSTTNDDKKQDLKRPSTPELQEPVKSKADLEPDRIEAITEDLVILSTTNDDKKQDLKRPSTPELQEPVKSKADLEPDRIEAITEDLVILSTTNDDKKQDLKRPSTPELQEPVKSKADLEPDRIEAITEDLVILSTTNDDKKQDLKRPSTPELHEPVKSKADLEPDRIEAITEDLVTLSTTIDDKKQDLKRPSTPELQEPVKSKADLEPDRIEAITENPVILSTTNDDKKQGRKRPSKRKRQKLAKSKRDLEPDRMEAITEDPVPLYNMSQSLGHTNTDRFGLPNLGQSCYMNSSLQSLLSLKGFMNGVKRTKQVWSSVPRAQLLRNLHELSEVHSDTETSTKRNLLRSFQKAVSIHAPEFRDNSQKDAHEFFSEVMSQVQSLAPHLQEASTKMGENYVCPVEENLMFKTENIRTCDNCGMQTRTQEDSTNLSLNLLPGGSTEDLLEMYMKEVKVEFRCDCGGTMSSKRFTFKTLPKVLVLHLNRIRYTSSYQPQKVTDAIQIQEDIAVPSNEGDGCYRLVSIISHFGDHNSGHYICDGVQHRSQPDKPTDRWLTFNDLMVVEKVSCPCEQRENSAYMLFYEMQGLNQRSKPKLQEPEKCKPGLEPDRMEAVIENLVILYNMSQSLGHTNTDRFGFPNLGQSCYMNSSLQSLLSLKGFIKGVKRTKQVWSSVPRAQLLRNLHELIEVHPDTETTTKLSLLRSFRKAVSIHAPEFRDNSQKDAHEFFSEVMSQVQSLAPHLQEAATKMGENYVCPVEENLMFKMENIRTCDNCGMQTRTQEDSTNLSLNLLPGGSTEDLLEMYMKEVKVEFRCDCGGTMSSKRFTFKTLPKVLVLHLNRIRYTSSYQPQKVTDAIQIQEHIAVPSNEGDGCYRLVSIISHFGDHNIGHYICDGVHPRSQPDKPTDRWLTFNDSTVVEKVSCPCEQRENSAYMLFYERDM